jgi:DNA-binding response OmpR family regulator
MSNLRNKLKKISGKEFIETVWGIGYKLSKNDE